MRLLFLKKAKYASSLGTEVAQTYPHMKTINYIVISLFFIGFAFFINSAFAEEELTDNPKNKINPKEKQVPVQHEQALPPQQAQPVREPAISNPDFFTQNENEVSAKDLLIKTITYLALIIGLILLMGFVSKHLLRNGSLSAHKHKKIKIIDSAFVEQKKYVYLVKVLDKAYVMASGANGGLTLIDKIDDLSALENEKTDSKEK